MVLLALTIRWFGNTHPCLITVQIIEVPITDHRIPLAFAVCKKKAAKRLLSNHPDLVGHCGEIIDKFSLDILNK